MSTYVNSLETRVVAPSTAKHRIPSEAARDSTEPAGWFESWYVVLLLASLALNAFVLYTTFHLFADAQK